MSKKTKTILMIVAVVVIIVALFIPYTKGEQEPIKLNSFSCSENVSNDEYETILNKTSCGEYQDLIKSSEESIVLIARPTCGACTYFTPILEKIVEEYDITINYFNTDSLTKEDINSFYSSSTLFESSEFGTSAIPSHKRTKYFIIFTTFDILTSLY